MAESISAADVAKLRAETGAGMMDCKEALTKAKGDMDAARKLLREQGLADAEKRKGREASDGLVFSYLHAPTPGVPARVGVMLEMATETDFTAKTEDVQGLAKDVAMHIAAAKPAYLSLDEVPEAVLDQERDLARKKVEGKPDKVIEQAVQGAVKKFGKQMCLLDQPWVRDDKRTVGELIASLSSKTGENLSVRRFVRYEVAESID